MAKQGLVKISELARRSHVPVATVRHYLREGLIEASLRTSRNMAWYDPALVPKIQRVKELQQTHFLPLHLIKDLFARGGDLVAEAAAAGTVAVVLGKQAPVARRSQAQLLDAGWTRDELALLARLGLVHPGRNGVYRGDDVALLRVLGAARKLGLRPDMLPISIMTGYVEAIRRLVAAEVEMFRAGVLGRAPKNEVARLTEAATVLSEQLVVLLRRKLLLPMLTDPGPKRRLRRD